jgi:hypothetical protein
MKFRGYTSYETEVFATKGGHIRIKQYDFGVFDDDKSTSVLLTPEQADRIALYLSEYAREARENRQELEYVLTGDEE